VRLGTQRSVIVFGWLVVFVKPHKISQCGHKQQTNADTEENLLLGMNESQAAFGAGIMEAEDGSDLDVEERDRRADRTDPDVIMAVAEDGPRIAFAVYNESTNQILLETTVANACETESIVERVLVAAQPRLLLLTSTIVSNDAMLDILTTRPLREATGDEAHESIDMSERQEPNGARHERIPYQAIKSKVLDVRRCLEIIRNKLQVRSIMRSSRHSRQEQADGGTSVAPARGIVRPEQGRQFPGSASAMPSNRTFAVSSYHALATVVNFESTVQVQALGSLISFLHSTTFRMHPSGFVLVDDVTPLKATAFMYMTDDTLSALQIFHTEHHPLVARGAGNAKEGFSLFSHLDRTVSRPGRQRLREWMVRPLLDAQAIEARLDGVQLFLDPASEPYVATLTDHLRHVGAIDQILVRMQKCRVKPNDFLVLMYTLLHGLEIVRTLHQMRSMINESVSLVTSDGSYSFQDLPRFVIFLDELVSQCDAATCQDVLDRIQSTIDEDDVKNNRFSIIRRGRDAALDEYRDRFDTLACE
jgi:MutS domain III